MRPLPTADAYLPESAPARSPGSGLHRDQLRAQVRQLSRLRPGWDSQGAPPPSEGVVSKALEVLGFLSDPATLPIAAVALAEGGVALVLMARPCYAALEVSEDGVVAAFSDRAKRQAAWEVAGDNDSVQAAVRSLHQLTHA